MVPGVMVGLCDQMLVETSKLPAASDPLADAELETVVTVTVAAMAATTAMSVTGRRQRVDGRYLFIRYLLCRDVTW